MALSNITVAQGDIEKFQPDISEYMFSGQSIADVVTLVKRKLERDIQIKADIDDDDLSKIKDLTQKYLYDRIIQSTIAEVFLQNNLLDKASVHQKRADSIPIRYYMDEDGDDVADEGEKDIVKNVFFGR